MGFQQSFQCRSFCLNEHFFLRWHKLRSFLGGFYGVIDIFLYMFSLSNWCTHRMRWVVMNSLNFCPKTGFGSFWSSKLENSSHFFPFFHHRSSSGQSSTLGSPHPFIHLSLQVVGNDFCWPNFIRGIFLKSTAPRWGLRHFTSKWEKTKEPTETG